MQKSLIAVLDFSAYLLSRLAPCWVTIALMPTMSSGSDSVGGQISSDGREWSKNLPLVA